MDIMTLEILEDGTIKVETGRISGPNHLSAESFLRETALEAGGEVLRKRKAGAAHTHTHHGQEHTH